ncbi:hypothetical protein MMC06_002153 [Schaereria dolodes]|nr:hypothetical protein [Schaereria dolodes]
MTKNPWKHVHIRTNVFDFTEWPLQELAIFKEFSVGEEQSLGLAKALAWSPPGIAKHGRSVLAVLTSNLVLSLWASSSNPVDGVSWERVLVVNHALSNYFKSRDIQNTALRKRVRIRAAAWASPCILSSSRFKSKLLAVSNDYHEVILLKVVSSYGEQLYVRPWWKLEVIGIYSDALPVENLRYNITHEIRWDDWKGDEAHLNTRITYISNGFTVDLECLLDTDPSSNKVRLKVLSSFKGNQVFQDHSDTHWDMITGRESECIVQAAKLAKISAGQAVVKVPGSKPHYLYQTRQLSGLQVFKEIGLRDQTEYTPCDGLSTMEKYMLKCKDRFAREHCLGEFTTLKTWGVASWNGYIAALITLHPAKMVEYVIPSIEQSILIFTHVHLDDMANSDSKEQIERFQWECPPEPKTSITASSNVLDFILSRKVLPGQHFSLVPRRIVYIASRLLAHLKGIEIEDRRDGPASPTPSLSELCTICTEPLDNTSITSARCGKGHLWRRATSSIELRLKLTDTRSLCINIPSNPRARNLEVLRSMWS